MSDKQHVIIVGDSFAAGEWNNGEVSHGGVAQYLHEDGFAVSNLSQPGGALSWVIYPLKNFLSHNKFLHTKKVVFFQTDISRDLANPLYQNQLVELHEKHCQESVQSLIDKMYKNFYIDINAVAVEHDIEILVIGGLTDVTADVSDLDKVQIVSVSMIQEHDNGASFPVRVMASPDQWLVLGQIFSKKKQDLLDLMDEQHTRTEYAKKNIEIFPDGFHPGRNIHHTCYKKLLTYL